ncbi:phenylacetate--CoA ligase family protein [Halobacillus sp. B23F22_1]|uniref:phenylacetate--CoA ligase family protein n=1 Tax=Halobacillus sp. B23F22_1 TaxID=3459514 RepID=UPI00373ED703
MSKLLKSIYLNSPFFIKKAMANIEGFRRNIYRRGGSYKKYIKNVCISNTLVSNNSTDQISKINKLLDYAKNNIPYYQRSTKSFYINSYDEMEKIPLTSKSEMKQDIYNFINKKKYRSLWHSSTSGSTGTPLKFFRDRKSMQFEYAIYDTVYDSLAGKENCVKARISGVNILKSENLKPPFWYFIKVFNQLQFSAYHINKSTYNYYLNALVDYKVDLGTGYPSAWLFLSQYLIDSESRPPNIQGIVTDSEGLSDIEKDTIEKAFSCPLYQTYGLGEVGMIGIQCKNNHYHILNNRCYVEVVNEDGFKVKNGESGEIVVTDLHSFDAPFIRYRTGDLGILEESKCGCGWNTPYFKKIIGRIDDYIIASEGRKISRLGFIARPAKGVLGMQIIQNDIGCININVLPTKHFDPNSMEAVLKLAKDYLGEMEINWSIVDELEKNNAGKVRYVIRNINQ